METCCTSIACSKHLQKIMCGAWPYSHLWCRSFLPLSIQPANPLNYKCDTTISKIQARRFILQKSESKVHKPYMPAETKCQVSNHIRFSTQARNWSWSTEREEEVTWNSGRILVAPLELHPPFLLHWSKPSKKWAAALDVAYETEFELKEMWETYWRRRPPRRGWSSGCRTCRRPPGTCVRERNIPSSRDTSCFDIARFSDGELSRGGRRMRWTGSNSRRATADTGSSW